MVEICVCASISYSTQYYECNPDILGIHKLFYFCRAKRGETKIVHLCGYFWLAARKIENRTSFLYYLCRPCWLAGRQIEIVIVFHTTSVGTLSRSFFPKSELFKGEGVYIYIYIYIFASRS